MPPKAKKKVENKDDGAEAKNDEERELVEKELVIGYLKTKLGRYQENGEKLVVDNFKLSEELETQKLNLRDINEFLTNELKARSLTTSALESKVQELNVLVEDVRRSHEETLKRVSGEQEGEVERLEGIISSYQARARIYQEFLERKEALEAELQATKDSLATKIHEWEQKQTDLDRQHMQDREKWKRELAMKIRETKLQMMKLTDNQLEMTTKRTIMENEQMSIELSYQSRQTEKLLGKNTMLVEENHNLRRQLELSKQTEEELAKRNNVYQKTIKSLLTKLKDQGWAQQEHSELVNELEIRVGDVEAQLHLAELTVGEREYELRTVQEKLTCRSVEADALGGTIDDAARFLLTCLADVKQKIVTVVQPDTTVGDDEEARVSVEAGHLDELDLHQRDRVLTWLIEKLHAFTLSAGLHSVAPQPLSHSRSSRIIKPSGLHTHMAEAESGGVGGGASGPGSTLPPITAFSRRTNHSFSSTLSQSSPSALGTVVWGGTEAAAGGGSGAWIGPLSPSSTTTGGRLGRSGLRGSQVLDRSVVASGTAGGSASGVESATVRTPFDPAADEWSAGMGEIPAASMASLPSVDDLLSRVMSDVRPWGKKSHEKPLTASKGGTFLKRAAALTSATQSATGRA